MVSCQALPELELLLTSPTVLTTVGITSKKKGVGDLTAELSGNVHEPDQPDDGRPRKRQGGTSYHTGSVTLDDLGLPVEHQAQGTTDRYQSQRLKRSVECKAAHR
jgi:hypothetical protein